MSTECHFFKGEFFGEYTFKPELNRGPNTFSQMQQSHNVTFFLFKLHYNFSTRGNLLNTGWKITPENKLSSLTEL